MEKLTTPAMSQLLMRTGLITEPQLQEVWDEVDPAAPDAEPLLRALERKGYLTQWQSQKLLKGESDGYFLGGYRILYKISSGSFGRVYRAEDPATGRVLAVKVLRRRWSEDPQRIELFEREGRVGLSLRHHNIVEVVNIGQDAATGAFYLVMEFVEGGNLREILQIRKKFAAAETLSILEDAAAALTYAFSRGVTHRDVKLTNILISSQGVAKLVDFGLAKIYAGVLLNDGERMERTVDYAGLEKATGVKHGDVRSDVFFLGCVGYELLCGRPPMVMTRDRYARMQKQRFDSIVPLRREEVDAPPSVFHLIESMMVLNPAQRYQTPAQLLDAIKAARREVEGKASANAKGSGPRTVFVVERDERLQEVIREKLKEFGYRVLLAGDPQRAVDRFRQSPFDALILDAGTVGDDGVRYFENVMIESKRQNLGCAGILILADEQKAWAEKVEKGPRVAVLVRPVGMKQLHSTLQKLVPQNQT